MAISMNDLCDTLNNYFVRERHTGSFSIEGGAVALPFLLDGQYFRIVNSVLNDGVYQYPCTTLTDETFSGEVWAMAVPPAVVALLAKINEWETKYGAAAASPYQSESFGGYSYSKTSGSNGIPLNWKTVFSGDLAKWRKI